MSLYDDLKKKKIISEDENGNVTINRTDEERARIEQRRIANRQVAQNFKGQEVQSIWDRVQSIANTSGKIGQNTLLGLVNGFKSYQQTMDQRMTETYSDRNKIFEDFNKKIQERSIQKGKPINLPTPIVSSEQLEEEGKQQLQKFQEEKKQINNKITENIESIDNPTAKKLAEVAPSMGNMGLGFVPGVGALLITGSSAGEYYDDGKQRGMSDKEAKTYSGFMSLMEGATEMVGIENLSKAGKVAKSLIKGAGKEGFKQIAKTGFKEMLKQYGIGIADNVMQEAIIEPIQELTAQTVAGKDKANWDNMGQRMFNSGFNGGLVSAIMGGANVGISSCVGVVDKINSGKQISQQEFETAVKDASKQLDVGRMVIDSVQQQVNKYKDYTTGKTLDNSTQNILNQAEDIINQNRTPNLPQNQTQNEPNLPTQQTMQEQNKVAQNGNMEQNIINNGIEYQKRQKTVTNQDNIKQYTQNDINRFTTGKHNLIDGYNSNIYDFVNEHYDEKTKMAKKHPPRTKEQKMFLGRINDKLSENLNNLINTSKRYSKQYNLKDYNIVLSENNIEHSFNHHGNEKEAGQIDITPEILSKYGDVISDPDYIGLSDEAPSKREPNPKLIFAKKINGYSVAIEVISDKKQLYPKAYYAYDSSSSNWSEYVKNQKLKEVEAMDSDKLNNFPEMNAQDDTAVTSSINNIIPQNNNNMQVQNKSFEDAVFDAMEDYEDDAEVQSPLQDRNINTIGKETKTNAYQYDNPKVKPYFQEMAQMIGEDLGYISSSDNRSTQKGGGTRLSGTTKAIDILHNEQGYSYNEIAKGLKNIIEDNGQENNAISKKIELVIDEQLRNGYTNALGQAISPNQEYIDMINNQETQQIENISTKEATKVLEGNDGNKLTVYHGSPNVNITEFDPNNAGSNTQSDFEGIYFTDNPSIAEEFSYEQLPGNSNLSYTRGNKGKVYENNLKYNNALNLNNLTEKDIQNLEKYIDSDKLDGISKDQAIELMKKMAQNNNAQGIKFYLDFNALKNDYDLIIADMGGKYKGSNEYIVFNNNQIISNDNTATNNQEVDKKDTSNEASINLPTQGETVNWNEIERPEGKIRKHYKSIIESSNTTAEAKKIAREVMETDTYIPDSRKKQLQRADVRIENSSPDSELDALMSKAKLGEKIDATDIAVGERLIQYYSKTGNKVKLRDAIHSTAMAGTTAGQTVQAMSLLNHQTPEGQALWIDRSVEKLNNKLKQKKGDKAQQFNFTPEMQERIVNSKNKAELEQNLEIVYKELGQQVHKSLGQQIDSWRYFAMLGNPRTHIRNIVGNFFMGKAQGVKNKVAGAIEGTVAQFNPEMERTHTLKTASKEVLEFAKNDIKNVASELELNENKYNPQSRIESHMKTFKSDAMENTLGKLFDINDKALASEDGWGLKAGYKKALAEYMTANNLTPSNITETQLAKARKYAVQQAKEATFHQANAIASAVNSFIGKNRGTKAIGDAVVPFVKTPANVAKAGVEYSPAGLAKSLIYDSVQLGKGNITVNQYIDNISKGLTGSAITVLGYALAKAGVLKASGSDDDKKEKFDQQSGKQAYSIQIGDKTYTIDWLAPVGIPLMVGAEIYEGLAQKSNRKSSKSSDDDKITKQFLDKAEVLANSLSSTLDPMVEMSMISGLTSTIKSFAQNDTDAFANMLTNGAKSYINQFVPTLLGQVAKTTDTVERDTTSTAIGNIPKVIDSTKNQIQSKIPGLRQLLPTKKDIWGNDVELADNWAQRFFEAGILPASKKQISDDEVVKSLNKLYDKNGNSKILPTTIEKRLTIDGQQYVMTNSEYNKYKTNYGKTSYKLINNLINSNDFKGLTDEQKEKTIENVYSYAKESNKLDYAKDNKLEVKPSTLYDTMEDLKKNGGNQASYLEYLAQTTGIAKESEKNKILKDSNYSGKTKSIIYKNGTGKDDKLYNLAGEKLNIDEYLNYKTSITNNSKKNEVIQSAYKNISNENERLLILANKIKLSNNQRYKLTEYINTFENYMEIYEKLSDNYVVKDGKVFYK